MLESVFEIFWPYAPFGLVWPLIDVIIVIVGYAAWQKWKHSKKNGNHE